MKVTSISYQTTIPTGPFMNDKFGVEISLDDEDTPLQAFEEARRITNEACKALNPHLAPNQVVAQGNIPPEKLPEIQVEKPKDTVSLTIEQINQASDITVLESFKLLASRSEKIKEAYDKRLNELSTNY